VSEAAPFFFEPEFNRAVKVRSRPRRITSDAGVLLLREADERLELTRSLASMLHDPRRQDLIRYGLVELLRSRIYALAQGYRAEDDLDRLAHDPAFRIGGWDRPGDSVLDERQASQPTHSRLTDTLSNDPRNLHALRRSLGDWVARHVLATGKGRSLQRATLDIDSFPIEAYGSQGGAEYHGYYREKIYHPLVAGVSHRGDFDSTRLADGFVHARLRRGAVDSADEACSFILEAVTRTRAFARSVDVRFDAAFAEGENLNALAGAEIHFVGRLRNNSVLDKLAGPHLWRPVGRPPAEGYERIVDLIDYRAESWALSFRVILVVIDRPDPKTGQLELFPHHFFLVTSWSPEKRSAADLLEHYRRRGTFEDRIGELGRAILPSLSSPRFEENEVHLLLALQAYNLTAMIRGELEATGESGWDLQRVRTSVLKAGAQILTSGRRLVVDIAAAVSWLWSRVVERISRWELPRSTWPPLTQPRREWIAPPRHAHHSVVLRQ